MQLDLNKIREKKPSDESINNQHDPKELTNQ
jgi:hypothetical protein